MKRTEDISILITDKSFQKILLEWGDLTETRKAEIYSEYELNIDDIVVLQQMWLSLDFITFEHPESEIEKALEETIWKLSERNNSSSQSTPLRKLYEQFARIAAILIIPVILYTTYIQFFGPDKAMTEVASQQITITSQAGTITKLALPDGSTVYLNSGSTISYPTKFDGHSRNVALTGEGYFEVVKNKKVPMVVSAGNVNLKVYGTSFNVNASRSANFVKVTLVEGSVSLSSREGKIEGKDEFFITPGQTATFSKDSKDLTLQNEDTFLFTAWKDGVLLFRNTTFETVLKQLSCKFNVDVELKDKSLASIPLDATFRDENINEILRLLALSTPFQFYYGTPQKLQDGTFAKSKIFIEKK